MFGDDEDIRSDKDLADDYRAGMERQERMIELMRAELDEKQDERERLRDAIEILRIYSVQTHRYWDASKDHKVGKRLLAMAGCLPGYDAEIDKALNLGRTRVTQ